MLEGYIFGRMGGWPGGKGNDLSSAAHFLSALNETRENRRAISMPVKRNSAVRLCFIGWRPTDAPTIFAEQGGRVKRSPCHTQLKQMGPSVLHCKFHKKIQVSQSAEVQVLRDRIRTIAIKPTNCFFLVFTKKSTAFLSLDFAAKMSAVTHHRRGIVAVLHFSPWLLFVLAQASGAKETDLVMSCLVFILHPFLGPQSFWTIIMLSYLPRHVFFFGSRSPHCRGHTTW